jgi:MFS family permease
MQVESTAAASPAQGVAGRSAGFRAVLAPLLVLSANVGSGVGTYTVFSPVQEIAKADLRISDFQVSLLQGLAASIPIAVLSIPLGRMVDRRNRVRLLLVLGLAWTLGALLIAFAHAFAALFAARMLAGVGALCSLPVAISIAADLTTPAQRGRSLLFLSLGKITGSALAFALGGWLVSALARGAVPTIPGMAPWRAVHLWFGAGSALLLLPVGLLHEPPRRELGAAAGQPLLPALREMWRRRGLLAPLFLGQVAVVMADISGTVWAAPVLTRNFRLQPADFAGWMGLVVLAAGALGSVLGGFAADVGHRRDTRGGILVGAVVAATLSIPGALFPIAPSTLSFAWLLALLLTCGAITGVVAATAIAVLVPNEIRGISLGLFIVIGALIGLGLAPTLVTLVSARLGGEAQLRYGLVATTVATSVTAAVGFGMALLTARRAGRPALAARSAS